MWEVVYPQSRAVDIDSDDEIEGKICGTATSNSTPLVRLSNDIQKPFSCKLLVIAFDRISTTFIAANFINKENEIVGLVSSCAPGGEIISNSLRQTDHSDKTCFLYSARKTNQVIFCQCRVNIPQDDVHSWAKVIFSSVNPEKVLILTTLPASVCLLDATDEPNRLFGLKTDHWKFNLICPYLPSPNIVSGTPAAVLGYCQVFNIPAAMYVAITATDSIDDLRALDTFSMLLQDEPLKEQPRCSRVEKETFLKSLKYRAPHLQSNMYI